MLMIELPDIVGQGSAVTRLQTCLSGDRRPHAFLFAGPRGVGRRTTAVAFARTLLCSSPVTDLAGQRSACGRCEDCTMQAADSHPDYHYIYKELARFHDDANVRNRVMQDLGIPVIRKFLIDPAYRSATRGRGKVFIIREADLMSIAAQNALLKTLEEPPPGVTIILLCQRPEQMLPTTQSRCSTVRFGPLPREFVAGKLIEQGTEGDEANFWAAYTDGAIGQAMRLAGQGFYEVKRSVLDGLAAMGPAGDAELGEKLVKQTDALAAEAVSAAKKADGSSLSKNLASRQAAGAMLELIASAFRDAMRLATGAQTPLIHADQPDAVAALASRHDPTALAEIIEQLSEYERLLWRNVNAKIIWDNAVITCATAAPLRL